MSRKIIEPFFNISIHLDPGDHPPSLPPPPSPQSPVSATLHVWRKNFLTDIHCFGISQGFFWRETQVSLGNSSWQLISLSGCAVAATCRLEPLLLPGKPCTGRKSHTREHHRHQYLYLVSRTGTVSHLRFYTCADFPILILLFRFRLNFALCRSWCTIYSY